MKKTVFLPCHPNMWEGFQTIWEKEISDPDNQVIVIPLPTYRIGQNGKLYDAEYITTGYPESVKIYDVNDYDLEAEHPDTIYIQNISDNNNPVFAVHPHFHTSNLRKFTDNLIYIPYSTLSDMDQDTTYLKRVYSKIITPPGIHNVDKIIVSSEPIRSMYLNLLSDGDVETYKKWYPKITCEDYPRISILKKYTKDTVPYPAAWNRHLFDSLGERKETVLFTTSVFGVLQYNRSHFRAAQKVFEEYEQKKDTVAFIWRPNKYLPDMIMKYRPELFDDFRVLLEYYITHDIGIFDETPTPTPAIILSDSYIGDECMVKELFESTGKPVYSNDANTL